MYELVSTHAQKKRQILLFYLSFLKQMPCDGIYHRIYSIATLELLFFFVALCFFFFLQLNWHRNTPLIWYIVLFTSRDQSLVAGGAAKLYEKDGETLGYSVLFLKILFFFLLFSFRCDDKGESAYMDKTMH